MATFDVYSFPNLVKGESSSAQIWVINKGNGDSDNANKITAGWEVRIVTARYMCSLLAISNQKH